MKKLLFIFILLVLAYVLFSGEFKGDEKITPKDDEKDKTISLCFYRKDSLEGYTGRYTLRLDLLGEKATGELNFLPAVKDSKIGKFEGTVSAVDPYLMGRRISAFWNTLAEGTEVTEELKIIFGEGTASIGMGILKDRGDGVYVYENPEDINYTLDLSDVSCDFLDELENVEKYLRANIKTLSPTQAVLGGSWYVVTFDADIGANTGTVLYEDGHIQEQRSFSYTTSENTEVTSMEIK